MKPTLAITLAMLVPAAAVLGQSARELKKELKTRLAAATKEKDPDKLCEVGQWASEKGLAADAKKIFTNVLRMNADHEGANVGLGNAKFDGKWMPKKKAEELIKKAQVAEFKAKGYVEVDGMWVEPDLVADAKRGVFHHEDDLVTKEELEALLAGKVRHPETGQLIDAARADDAAKKLYPVGREGRWGDQKAADSYYGDLAHPWFVRTKYGTMMTTLPMDRIQELKAHIDRGFERVAPLLGGSPPLPPNRPLVIVAPTVDEYNRLGTDFGDENSASTAYLMANDRRIQIPFHGQIRAGICDASNKDLAPYYTRHAAAMAYLAGKCADAGATVPQWFEHGIGALASRFENDWDGAHFCRTGIVPKGGVKNLKSFFNSFAINPDMDPSDIAFNVTMAGLMFHFATKGGDSTVTDAMVALTDAFKNEDKSGIEKGAEKLQAALIQAEAKIAEHHQKLLADNR
ncbi:MAG: hypothetical protein KDC98_17280 [Planctomycetes bacterium]|nr:hypothetical protein [Planctomycetota bacterium]